MKNLIQLYFDNGKSVPFIARRSNWSKQYGLLVTDVKPRKTKSGWYGEVQGFALPPLDGSPANDYWGEVNAPREVPNSGSYQWSMVGDVPAEWKRFVEKAGGS